MVSAGSGPVYAEGKTVVKKGCLGIGSVTPRQCFAQAVNLPGFRLTRVSSSSSLLIIVLII